MRWRALGRTVRDPLWAMIVGGVLIGALAGTAAAGLHEEEDEDTAPLFGHAWRGTALETRGGILKIFGLQLTVLTLVMSVNTPMIQSAANQYSPRLVPFYLRRAPIRHAVPVFVIAGAYNVAAIRALGFQDDRVRAQVVLSGAVLLAIAAFVMLAVVVVQTFRFLRVERVLALVREGTFAAMGRLERAGLGRAHRPTAAPALFADAVPIHGASTGYLVSIDAAALARVARAAAVRVRISRGIGEYLDVGEVVGWAASDRSRPIEPDVTARLARPLETAATRDPGADPLYGVRILADVAARALGSSSNDAYTARQALHQVRSVLRRLAATDLGDWCALDPDGVERVSGIGPVLREFVSVGVEAPLRCGAGEPEILDGVLEIALELGLAASQPEGRAIAYQLVARVLDDAAQYGDLRDGRYRRLLEEANLVKAALDRDLPRADRHARCDWALRADDGASETQPHDARA